MYPDRAHPHVCGEHPRQSSHTAVHWGSSPRMRGTPLSAFRVAESPGLIPTYAGNTPRFGPCRWSTRAHPHVCGEHQPNGHMTSYELGSSPRMRGTRGQQLHALDFAGLIPTYAGNTSALGMHCCIGSSSPRMRGTRLINRIQVTRRGLIPTYAGNTCSRLVRLGLGWAHPHVCGEHAAAPTTSAPPLGSSPRMRGTPWFQAQHPEWVGLIPTYAGNTYWRARIRKSWWAHPHVCGEHKGEAEQSLKLEGSSPRMRGTLVRVRGFGRKIGLIPTYAGNT